MNKASIEKIKNDSDFQKLVKKRTSIMIILTLAELLVYFGFILLVAFNKEFFS